MDTKHPYDFATRNSFTEAKSGKLTCAKEVLNNHIKNPNTPNKMKNYHLLKDWSTQPACWLRVKFTILYGRQEQKQKLFVLLKELRKKGTLVED